MSAPVEPSTAHSMNGMQGHRVITQHTAEGDRTIRAGNTYRPMVRTAVGPLLSVMLALQVTGCTSGKSAEAPESPAASTPSSSVQATTPATPATVVKPEASPVAAAAATSKPTEDDLARLAKEVESKKSAHLAELKKSGGFLIAGEIKRRTKDTLIIWGVAANWAIAKDSQEGIMYENGNIIVRNYNEERIVGTYYQPQVHYFIEQTDGKNAFGASVAVNVYGDEPAKQKAKRIAYEDAQRRYDELEAIVHPPAPPAPAVVIPRHERIFPIVNKVAERNGLKIDKPLSESTIPDTATWSSEELKNPGAVSLVKVIARKPNFIQYDYAWDHRMMYDGRNLDSTAISDSLRPVIYELGEPPEIDPDNLSDLVLRAITWESPKRSSDIVGDQMFTGSGYRPATPEELGTAKATLKDTQIGEYRITGQSRSEPPRQFLTITIEFKP